MKTITWEDFHKVEIHIGTVLTAEPFPEARVPDIKLTVDFGPLGVKQTSAQIAKRYAGKQLLGRQVAAVTNFDRVAKSPGGTFCSTESEKCDFRFPHRSMNNVAGH